MEKLAEAQMDVEKEEEEKKKLEDERKEAEIHRRVEEILSQERREYNDGVRIAMIQLAQTVSVELIKSRAGVPRTT